MHCESTRHVNGVDGRSIGASRLGGLGAPTHPATSDSHVAANARLTHATMFPPCPQL